MTDEELKEEVAKAVKDYSNLCLGRTLSKQTTPMTEDDVAEFIHSLYTARIEQAKMDERNDLIDRLSLYEGELGFCEISNHVSYSEIIKEGK